MQENWEQQAIKSLLEANVIEQRRKRRWGIFFKLLGFAYLFTLIFIAMGWIGRQSAQVAGAHTAVISLSGVISPESEPSTGDLIGAIRSAFADANTQAIILRANSPGGSPVQAGMIYDEIQRLRKLHPKIPFYTVIEDVCASGCYYAAAASDRIYADKASLVGSIGVLMDGFGFTGAMDKLGVERRLLTAGTNKGFLDPFSPLNEDQRGKAQVMLDEIHGQFISAVKQGRGKRLKDNPDLFSGLIWSGSHSQELGLIDGLGSVDSVARDVVKVDNVVDFTPQREPFDRFTRFLSAELRQSIGANWSSPLR
ncbi:S49 family peptidase [Chitinibacteraceae bacterium HSL-7]